MLFTPFLEFLALLLLCFKAEGQSPNSLTVIPTVPTVPAPTASPTPTPGPILQDLLAKLVTAALYVSFFSNGGDYQALCDALVPENLSNIGSGGINGTAIKNEICTGAQLVAANAALEPFLVETNQRGVDFLAVALFAVQVAGNYAGGPDLNTLCSEIEAERINLLFIGFTDTDTGTQIKDYVCGATASPSSATAAARPTQFSMGYYDYTLP